ncbi:MAG: hypothetical protein PHI63_06410, partial [Patescibacteria group bacterium]|nr:hypothetical protein [Patescibacteria group bacterium]
DGGSRRESNVMENMRSRKFMFGILVIVLAAFGGICPASAVGIAIQPAHLRISAEWGSMASGAILVSNTTPQPAMYQVAAAPTRELTAAPAAFRLDPGGSQLVELRYAPRSFLDSRPMLTVVARPIWGRGLPVASGIRYPVTLIATSLFVNVLARAIACLAVAVFAGIMWRRAALRSL